MNDITGNYPLNTTEAELRVLSLEHELGLVKNNFDTLSAKYDKLFEDNIALGAELAAQESQYAELKLKYDTGFSAFLSDIMHLDEERLTSALSKMLETKAAEMLDNVMNYPLPKSLEEKLGDTVNKLIECALENGDFSYMAEGAAEKAVEDALNDVRITFRR